MEVILFIIFGNFFLFIVFIILVIYNNISKNVSSNNYYINKKKESSYIDVYFFKGSLITKNELNFYHILLDICNDLDFILFCQVSLYQIVGVQNKFSRRLYYSFFNKISRKCIDFVFCDKNDCSIKLCIELDDSSHNRKDRIYRDNFINDLFHDLSIPLLRYNSTFNYDKSDIKNCIYNKLQINAIENLDK